MIQKSKGPTSKILPLGTHYATPKTTSLISLLCILSDIHFLHMHVNMYLHFFPFK